MEMPGIRGAPPIAGTFTALGRLAGLLTEIDGVSDTEIVGTEGDEVGLGRGDGAWDTFIVGTDGTAV